MSGVDLRQAVLELAVEASGLGAFDWDLLTGDLVFDGRLLELFGYDEVGFTGTIEAFNARVHQSDLPTVEQLYGRAIESCGEYEAEYRVVLPDGTTRWVAARGRALPGADGTAVRLIGVAYDATARLETEARVARVLGALGMAFFSLDREWRFSFVNAEAERVLQRGREDLLGGVVWDLFPAAVGSEFERHYRHAVESGQEVSFDAYYPEPLNAWYEVRAWPGPDGLAVYFLDVTERRRAQAEADRAVTRAAVLARVSTTLSSTAAADVAARGLAQVVVPDLADWAIATLVDDDRRAGTRRGLVNAGAWHRDPDKRHLVDEYAQDRLSEMVDDSIVVRAMETADPQVIVRDATPEVMAMYPSGPARDRIAELAPYSVVVLPLIGSNAPVGMLTLCNGEVRGEFSEADLATAREVAARAGIVLDNARLYRRQRQIAEGLQRALLTEPPQGDNFEISVRYSPASEATQVGGDWYDAFMNGAGRLVVVIGDVMGHDVDAAAAMGQVRTLVRGMAAVGSDTPGEVLSKVDTVMSRLALGTTASAVVGQLELGHAGRGARPGGSGEASLRWSNAGHPLPMVLRSNGDVTVLGPRDGQQDVLLGVVPDVDRHEQVASVAPGDVVLLYTDGLVERRDQSLGSGMAHLASVLGTLAGRPLDYICDEVLERCVPERLEDDVAVVAVRLLG